MSYEHLLYEVRDRVAHITLNRPDKMNALHWALRQELYAALKAGERDRDVGSIVIKGAGRCFSAGYDLTPETPSPNFPDDGYVSPEIDNLTGQYAHNLINGWWMIWDLTKPVIAQVHGFCLAGGSELASMCDLMFVAEDATLGYPPVRGISPPDTLYFPWKLPMSYAKYMMFTGRSLSGAEAVEKGWATKCFAAEDLAEEVHREASAIASIKPDLLACSKKAINRSYEIMGIKTALETAADWQGLSMYRESANDFLGTAAEKGLKAALAERDGPFGDYSMKNK
jgi:enoyl-CoA hydratase